MKSNISKQLLRFVLEDIELLWYASKKFQKVTMFEWKRQSNMMYKSPRGTVTDVHGWLHKCMSLRRWLQIQSSDAHRRYNINVYSAWKEKILPSKFLKGNWKQRAASSNTTKYLQLTTLQTSGYIMADDYKYYHPMFIER